MFRLASACFGFGPPSDAGLARLFRIAMGRGSGDVPPRDAGLARLWHERRAAAAATAASAAATSGDGARGSRGRKRALEQLGQLEASRQACLEKARSRERASAAEPSSAAASATDHASAATSAAASAAVLGPVKKACGVPIHTLIRISAMPVAMRGEALRRAREAEGDRQ